MPGSFAVTMATGIVSAALRLAASLLQGGTASGGTVHAYAVPAYAVPASVLLANVLLGVTAASFGVLLVASLARLALFRADLSDDLANPARAFSAFAFVAACDVLGSDLAAIGRRGFAAALTITALLAWLALTGLVPGRLLGRVLAGVRPFPLRAVGGNWYLWVVGTQSLAIALTDVGRGGQAARAVALAAWILGIVLYAAVSGLILVRLRRIGLPRADPTAPYWVAMGAASISILAAGVLLGSAWAPSGSARTAMTWIAVGLWALASVLIVPLAARSAWRHVGWHQPLRYRLDLWMIIFPSGMYATASMSLGANAHLPVLVTIGRVAVWPAAIGWVLVFGAMAAVPIGTLRSPGRARDLSRGPIVEDMDEPTRRNLNTAARYDDDRPGDPPCLQRRVCPACGSVADEDPPTTCPTCGTDLPGE